MTTPMGRIDRPFAWLVLFAVLMMLPSGYALAGIGEACSSTGDCAEGYCQNGVCTSQAEAANYSIIDSCDKTTNCIEGYCEDNICILPQPSSLYEAGGEFAFGPKAGCAGIVDVCTGGLCSFCDSIWILVAVGAVTAAFLARKRRGFLPLLAVAIPLAIALTVLPILGLLTSIVEIFFMLILKGRRLRLSIRRQR